MHVSTVHQGLEPVLFTALFDNWKTVCDVDYRSLDQKIDDDINSKTLTPPLVVCMCDNLISNTL